MESELEQLSHLIKPTGTWNLGPESQARLYTYKALTKYQNVH